MVNKPRNAGNMSVRILEKSESKGKQRAITVERIEQRDEFGVEAGNPLVAPEPM